MDNKWWLLAGTLCVWGILMFLWPSNEQHEGATDTETHLEMLSSEQEIIIPPVSEVSKQASVEKKARKSEPEVKETKKVTQAKREKQNKETKRIKEVTPVKKDSEPIKTKKSEEMDKLALVPKSEERVTDHPSVIDVQPLEQKDTLQKKTVQKKKDLVLLKPDGRKKILLVQPLPEKKREPLSSPAEVPSKSVDIPLKEVTVPGRDAEELFNERLKASSTWLAWAYRGGFTIQLMVLASGNAVDNLKKILVDDKYFAIKDQLYILRKRSPQTIYVFYGNYSSMDMARLARNKMPQFLRDNQPYVLSIQDALKKIKE